MQSSSITVLYVEDDDRLRTLTKTYLERHGVTVVEAPDGGSALSLAAEIVVDVVLLDLMLPDTDGHSLCRQLREMIVAPIIMVSALDEEADRVLGLEGGADDYVTKPFSSRELLARIRAQVRRSRATVSESEQLVVGSLVIDISSRTVSLEGESIQLTSQEFDLLMVLAQRAGHVLSRDQLITHLHERGDEVFERAIDVQISRLRQKLNDDPRDPRLIKTVRGVGYLLAREVS